MVSRYVSNFNMGVVHHSNTTSPGVGAPHLPAQHPNVTSPMPLGVAMATAISAAAAIVSTPPPPQSQQQLQNAVITVSANQQHHQHQQQAMRNQQQQTQHSQLLHHQQQQHQQPNNLKIPPPNAQEYHLHQCIIANHNLNGVHLQQQQQQKQQQQQQQQHQQQQQQQQQHQHQHYCIKHSRSDGYVAASSAGYSAPQSGPPHQGPPTVIRGMQSTTPSTPPQKQDLSKMQPSQVYVPPGNSNTSGNVRQQQSQLYRNTPTGNVPRNHGRHNSTLISPQMYSSQIQPVAIMQYQQFPQRAVQFPPPSYQHFSQFQLPNPYGQTSIYFQNAAQLIQTSNVSGIPNAGGGGHNRGVPNNIVQTSGSILAGPTGAPAQNQMLTPTGVLTQATANAGGPTQVGVAGVQVGGTNATIVGSVVSGPGQQPAGSGMVGHNASSRRKQLKHAIPIIDPATNKNVLDDYINPKAQNATNNEVDYTQETQLANSGIVNNVAELDNSLIMPEFVDQTKTIQGLNYADIPQKMPDLSETPIVSAKSLAPSVDIHLQQKPQKRKNKQIEIVAPQQTSETIAKASSDENHRSTNNNLNQKVTSPCPNTSDQQPNKTGQQQDLNKITTSFTAPQQQTGTQNQQQQFNTSSVSNSASSAFSLTSASIPAHTSNNTTTQQQLPLTAQLQHQSVSSIPVSQIQSQYQQKENNKISSNHNPTNTGKFIGANTGLPSTLSTQKQQQSSRQQQQTNRNSESNKQQINRSNSNNNNTFTTDSVSNSTTGGNVTLSSTVQHHGASSITTQTITTTQLDQTTTTTITSVDSKNINNNNINNNSSNNKINNSKNNNSSVTQSMPEQQQHYKPVNDTKLPTSVGVSTVNMASTVAQTITSSPSATNIIKDNINTSGNSLSKISTISKDETDRSVKLDNVDIINNNNNKNNNKNNNSNNSSNNNNSYMNQSTITGNTAIPSSKSNNEKVNENITAVKPHNEHLLETGTLSGATSAVTNSTLNNSTNASSNNNNSNNKRNTTTSNIKKPDCDNISNGTSNSSQTEPLVTASALDTHLVTTAINSKIENDTISSQTDGVETKTSTSDNVNNPGDVSISKIDSTVAISSTTSGTSSASLTAPSLISYNDGQWSPQNLEGSKVYNRKQLLKLRQAPLSNVEPQITSEAARMLLPKVVGIAPSPQPNLLPNFARNLNNKRHQSMGNPMPSGSLTSMGTNSFLKNHSTSIVNPKNNAKGSKSGMIQISLSLREDVKLNETENAWRPSHLLGESMTMEERNREELKRKIRGILNKLTPEKFEPLVSQILSLQIDTTDKVNEVIYLVFEKAIDEPNFSVSYAKLCHRLVREVNLKDDKTPTKNFVVFRNVLLDRTEREFTENVTNQESKERRLRPIVEKLKECQDQEKKLELQAQLEEEERKIRRRSGGTVRFIGELFKLSMLTCNIMRSCIQHLLDIQSEDKLECLCKLLTTVGEKYESSSTDVKSKGKNFSLEGVIKEMQNIVDRKEGAKVSSRIRFMLQDVIDLRKNHWITSKTDIPKTMEQIQKEAKTEQMSNQYMNFSNSIVSSGNTGSSGNNSNNNKKDNDTSGRRGGGNSFGGNSVSGFGSGSGSSMSYGNNSGGSGNRGGNNDYFNKNRSSNQQQDSDAWYTQTAKGKAVDANKLGQMSNLNYDMDNGGTTLGASSQFIWNHGSNPRPTSTSTTSNSFAALSNLDSNKGSNSGPRNKGSFSKSSMERDRYSSAHGSRESSSSRNPSSNRNDMNDRLRDRDIDRVRERNDRSSGLAMKKTSSQQNYTLSNTSVSSNSSSSSRSTSKTTSNVQGNAVQPLATFDLIAESENLFVPALKKIVDLKCDGESLEDIVHIVVDFPESKRWGFFYYIFNNYLHMAEVKSSHRKQLADITKYLLEMNYISIEDIKKGCIEFSPVAADVCIDVPAAWQYIFEYFGPLIHKKLINVKDIWNETLKTSNMGKKFLKHFILYCTKEIGPDFMRQVWRTQNLKWADFVGEDSVESFIQQNKFQFVESTEIPYTVTKQEDINIILNRIGELLAENANKDAIIDYLSANIMTVNKQFIRGLTTDLLNYSINSNYKLDEKRFSDICCPLLQRYIDSKPQMEMECLHAIQILINHLEHPQGLLIGIFIQLYELEIINQDSFISWRDSNEEYPGKGVAAKQLHTFFTKVLNENEVLSETSDENN